MVFGFENLTSLPITDASFLIPPTGFIRSNNKVFHNLLLFGILATIKRMRIPLVQSLRNSKIGGKVAGEISQLASLWKQKKVGIDLTSGPRGNCVIRKRIPRDGGRASLW